jgi:hypothetical protein
MSVIGDQPGVQGIGGGTPAAETCSGATRIQAQNLKG